MSGIHRTHTHEVAELQNDDQESSSQSSGKILNWDAAIETVDGDEELLRIVLTAMLEECPQRLNDLKTAIEQQDPQLLRRSAHTVKGNLRIFGACRATEIAQELEAIGESGTCEGASPVLDSLMTEMDGILREVKEFVDGS